MTERPGTLFQNGMRWEMSDAGRHRIVEPDGTPNPWCSYSELARAKGGDFIAATSYFLGVLPVGVLLEVKTVKRA